MITAILTNADLSADERQMIADFRKLKEGTQEIYFYAIRQSAAKGSTLLRGEKRPELRLVNAGGAK
jgi:hypothetical protein